MPKAKSNPSPADSPAKRPDPHDFTLSRDDWENAVFINADHFVLSRRLGIGEYERIELATWPEVLASLKLAADLKRIFIYAVTEPGRSVNLNGPDFPARWDALWTRWRS